MKKYAFGVDIGGTTCKIGFFDTNGTLLDKWEIKTNTENNGESILSDVAKAVDNKLAQEAISKDDVQESESEFRDRLTARAWYTVV